jgi:AcrR family transcriptional regulator
MLKRKFLLADPAEPEIPDNVGTHSRIDSAVVSLMAEDAKLNHDSVAARAGVSRRTVYRYYPDQNALRRAATNQMGPSSDIPRTLADFTNGLASRFVRFDSHRDAMTVMTASAQGRTIRNQVRPQRVEAFRSILIDQTADLPEPDRTGAAAVLQYLGSALAWREMRDQWGMDGETAAAACRWAIETLLADLEKREGRPLSEGTSN